MDWIKKYWKRIVTIIAIGGLTVFLSSWNRCNLSSGLASFNSAIWGTVADWTIVVLTAAGLFCVIWTLRDQIKINKQSIQQGVRKIRPYFKVKYIEGETKDDDDYFLLYLTNAIAFEVSFIYLGNEPHEEGHYKVWELHYEGLRIENDLSHIPKEADLFTVSFKDEEGRMYKQKVVANRGDVYTLFPVLIKDL